MNQKESVSWKEAFMTTPGPRTIKEAVLLFLKGVCMGSADIIPGVSGGTIALITGIYEDWMLSIKSIGLNALKKLMKFDLKGVLQEVHLRFLISLILGILIALISLARLMNFLLHNYPEFTWSLFFGLIAASILVVGKKVNNWIGPAVIWFILGTIIAYFIVSMIPVSTPEDLWFIFLTGFIGICAMILPGLSGAFILLILGKYEFITGAVKDPFVGEHMVIMLVFGLGMIAGILMFSRILSYLLDKYHSTMLAFLTGLMAGAMQKIWPWKEVVETKVVRGKAHDLVVKNILPQNIDADFLIAVSLAIVGFIFVILLERFSDTDTA